MKKLKYWLLLLFAKKHVIMNTTTPATSKKSIYDLKIKTLDGQEIDFSRYKGKKLLIVNTASECGYTPQYEELQHLHQTQGNKITVLGFPANNFGGQEPGTNEEIGSFCQKIMVLLFSYLPNQVYYRLIKIRFTSGLHKLSKTDGTQKHQVGTFVNTLLMKKDNSSNFIRQQ